MPELILELIEILGELLEGGSVEEALGGKLSEFIGSKAGPLGDALKGLTGEQNAMFKKEVGDELHEHIMKHFTGSGQEAEKVDCSRKSSWVEYIDWVPKLNVATLKIQNNPKLYKLPFFPKQIITLIQHGASPGKTMWRKYWRVIGKGRISNKLKNKVRVDVAKKTTKLINVAVPALRVPKITKRGRVKKNLIKKVQVKTANIPKTGAKGIKITIKAPKKRKY